MFNSTYFSCGFEVSYLVDVIINEGRVKIKGKEGEKLVSTPFEKIVGEWISSPF